MQDTHFANISDLNSLTQMHNVLRNEHGQGNRGSGDCHIKDCQHQETQPSSNPYSLLEQEQSENHGTFTDTSEHYSSLCGLSSPEFDEDDDVVQLVGDQLGEALELMDILKVLHVIIRAWDFADTSSISTILVKQSINPGNKPLFRRFHSYLLHS